MAGGFLSGIVGKVTKGVLASGSVRQAEDTFATAFWYIEQWQSGLVARALSYAVSGDDRPVLLEIDAQRQKPRQQPAYSDRGYHQRMQ